MKMRIVLVLAL